jgi:hypothetical protein
MDENIEGEAVDKGKNYVIREICKIDKSKTPDELKKYVFSELVKMKKELGLVAPKVEENFRAMGAYSFSSFREQEEDV